MNKMCVARIIVVAAVYLLTLTWQHTALCAAYQYFILGKNGNYEYGYRTGNGIVARQEADSLNQASGHYFYGNDLGNFGMKYASGFQGYSPQVQDPENLESSEPQWNYQKTYLPPIQANYRPEYSSQRSKAYHFSFDTGNYKKEEGSDPTGNVRGYFAYKDNAGLHDLSYTANDKTGYRVTGGNLAPISTGYLPPVSQRPSLSQNAYTSWSASGSSPYVPITSQDAVSKESVFPFTSIWDYQNQLWTNNLNQQQFLTPYYLIDYQNSYDQPSYLATTNRSYNFSFDTGNYKKEESSDADGNVRGYFEYEDALGRHYLRYTSSDKTGFQVTGGNLQDPVYVSIKSNGRPVLPNQPNVNTKENNPGRLKHPFNGMQNPYNPYQMKNFRNKLQYLSRYLNNLLDSLYDLPYTGGRNHTYHFVFDTVDYKIEESAYPNGEIRGYFQINDNTGHHDLSYTMNDRNEFQVTGGSLARDMARYLPPFTINRPDGFANNPINEDGNLTEYDTRKYEEDVTIVIGKTTIKPEITEE